MIKLKKPNIKNDLLVVVCIFLIVFSIIMVNKTESIDYEIVINTDDVLVIDNGYIIENNNITIRFSLSFDLNATKINYCFIQHIPPKSQRIYNNPLQFWNKRILNMSTDKKDLVLIFYILVDIEYTLNCSHPEYSLENVSLKDGDVKLDIKYIFFK